MEDSTLIIAFEELAQEQKKQADAIAELMLQVKDLTFQVKQLQEKARDTNPPKDILDYNIIERIIKKELLAFKLSIVKYPHNVIRKFQILLFPERDQKLFYRVVFGRWFLWISVMVLFNYSYRIFVKWTDNKKEITLNQLELDRYRKAWKIYYGQQNKVGKIRLDSIYKRIDW